MRALLDPVLSLLHRAAQDVVLPRFQALDPLQIQTKSSPHDLVTIADREAEALLTEALCALLPGSVAVGEEAVSLDAGILDHLRGSAPVWLIDPVDGTWNFVAGDPRFCMMVALSVGDRVEASWILEPLRGRAFAAVRGQGTWRQEAGAWARVQIAPPPADVGLWRGAAYHRHILPEQARPRPVRQGSAGIEYGRILMGEAEFSVYDRPLPWDHAPGSLLLSEAGGCHAFIDGVPYHPSAGLGRAVVATADAASWPRLIAALLPDPAAR